jgi:hypothetical protein
MLRMVEGGIRDVLEGSTPEFRRRHRNKPLMNTISIKEEHTASIFSVEE